MTACRNKARGAVVAALAGALTLGAAPVMALADGADLQSVAPTNAWVNGSLTAAEDNSGHVVTDLDNIEFEVGSDCKYLIPTEITPAGEADPVEVSFYDVKWERLEADGSWTRVYPQADAWGIGTYRAVVDAPEGSGYAGAFTVEFRVVGKSLKGLDLYNAASGSVYDDSFTYTGILQEIGYTLDGKKVDVSSLGTVTYYVAGTDTVVSNPVEVGNYVARVEGIGDYFGSVAEIPFTIGQLDLTTADVVISDTESAGEPTQATVNGVLMGTDSLKFEFVSAANGSGVYKDFTTYTVKVSPADGNDNVTGSQEVTFSRVAHFVADSDITYGGSIFTKPDGSEFVVNEPLDGKTMYVLIDKVDSYFNPEKISIKGLTNDLDWVTVTDASGNVVDAATVNTVPGTYTVTVRVNAADTDYEFGSNTVTMTVKTYKTSVVADASLYFKYDNKVVDGDEPLSVTYDGTDVMDDIDVLVQTDDATLAEGSDYDVTIYDANGTEVDGIVDAGTYTVQVTSDLYNLQYWSGDCSLTVVVNPISLNMVFLGSDDMKIFGDNDPFIPYTGEAVDYYFYYMDGDEQVRVPDGVLVLDHFNYDTNLSGQFDATDSENVAEIREAGRYNAVVSLAEGVKNYTLGHSQTQTVTVMPAKVFADVDASAWYAEPVYDAKTLGYMTGYDDGTFFGPADSIKRGDVCMVLWKMAGRPEVDESGDSYDETTGFVTGFSDVDGTLYYGEAIAWASRLGIVTGDDGKDTFRPDDTVTREELAKMLYKYSELQDKTYDVDEDAVLSAYDDEDTVSEWAREYVAWMVDQDVMGQDSGLKGNQPISRAEVATMTVRLQPEGKLSPSDFLK